MEASDHSGLDGSNNNKSSRKMDVHCSTCTSFPVRKCSNEQRLPHCIRAG